MRKLYRRPLGVVVLALYASGAYVMATGTTLGLGTFRGYPVTFCIVAGAAIALSIGYGVTRRNEWHEAGRSSENFDLTDEKDVPVVGKNVLETTVRERPVQMRQRHDRHSYHVVSETPVHTEARGSVSVVRRGLFEDVRDAGGSGETVITGDEQFDDEFRIRTTNKELASAVLSAEVKRELVGAGGSLDGEPVGNLVCDAGDGTVELVVPSSTTDPELLEQYAELTATVAEHAERFEPASAERERY